MRECINRHQTAWLKNAGQVCIANVILTRRELKMWDWKMRHRRKCNGGKCASGQIGTRPQGWKMQDEQVSTAKSHINKTHLQRQTTFI